MAKRHKVRASQLGATMKAHENQRQARIVRGLQRAALRGMKLVVADTPVDRGLLRATWDVVFLDDGADLLNDAAHAGIVEKGSRPHRPPFKPILQWVVRKFGLNLEGIEARREAEEKGGDPDRAQREATQNARRSLPDDDESQASAEARSLAWAVVETIAEEGTEPAHMVQDNLPKMRKQAREEVEKQLRKGP